MVERVFCTIDPNAPGVIRLTPRLPIEISAEPDVSGFGFADPRIAWTLKVRDARLAVDALSRALARKRLGRNSEYYRCEPDEARSHAIRFTTLRRETADLNDTARVDRIMVTALCIAFGLGLVVARSFTFSTQETVSMIATVLCALTALAGIVTRKYGLTLRRR